MLYARKGQIYVACTQKATTMFYVGDTCGSMDFDGGLDKVNLLGKFLKRGATVNQQRICRTTSEHVNGKCF